VSWRLYPSHCRSFASGAELQRHFLQIAFHVRRWLRKNPGRKLKENNLLQG